MAIERLWSPGEVKKLYNAENVFARKIFVQNTRQSIGGRILDRPNREHVSVCRSPRLTCHDPAEKLEGREPWI